MQIMPTVSTCGLNNLSFMSAHLLQTDTVESINHWPNFEQTQSRTAGLLRDFKKCTHESDTSGTKMEVQYTFSTKYKGGLHYSQYSSLNPAIKGSASGTIFRLMENASTRTSANQGNAASLLCVQCKSLKNVTTNIYIYIFYIWLSLFISTRCV